MEIKEPQKMRRTQDDLDKRELLEQYVLGLTDRSQSERARALLQQDAEAREDLAYLQAQISAYADAYCPVKQTSNRTPRSPEDFDDLDHEMIMAMTERNHALIIWRYALGLACLLLLGLSGYLFRQYQTSQTALVTEKALHAQDDISHQLRLESLEENVVNWAGLRTTTLTTSIGDVLVHYPDKQGTVLLDFSHLTPPAAGYAYYLFPREDSDDQPAGLILTDGQLNRLYPLDLPVKRLRIYHWEVNAQPLAPLPDENLVADLTLAAAE